MTDERTRSKQILVVANETVVSPALVELIEERAKDGAVYVTVLAPINQPRQGYVVYYDTRRAAARRRLEKTLDLLRSAGVPADGIVVESDPVSALQDAIHQLEPDEIVVSTHPQQKSGWLRRNAVEQMRRVAGDLPFQHVVVDLAAERGQANVLVVANQTVLGAPLLDKIRERAKQSPASFLIISPQGESEGSYESAERRLLRAVSLLRGEGLDVHGQISHPDPFSAVMQTMEDERVDELIVSTFPNERSGWLRRNLLERLRDETKLPIEHVHEEHPPEPHYSSRVSPSVLGMFLFIGTEVMLFGSFFTAYFFVRVVAGTAWPTPPFHLPIFVAFINTCILVTSSFTMHWALQSVKRGNVWGLRAGLLLTFLMGLSFLVTQGIEYSRVGFALKDGAFATIFYCLTGLHGAHVFVGLSILLFMTIRAFRGHFSPEDHRGVEIGGIYWHFVDVMWIIVYMTVYIL